jgi:hypothetical protein
MTKKIESLNEGLFSDFEIQELEARFETDPLIPSASLGVMMQEPSDFDCFTCYLCFSCDLSL